MACTSCVLTSGFTNAGCDNYKVAAGLRKLYIANACEVASFTDSPVADGVLDIVTMVGAAVFFEFDFSKFSASFTSSVSSDNTGIARTHSVSFSIPGYDASKQAIINALDFASVVVIAETNTNQRFVLGYANGVFGGLEIETSEVTSGAAKTDFFGTTITMSAYVPGAPEEFLYSALIPV